MGAEYSSHVDLLQNVLISSQDVKDALIFLLTIIISPTAYTCNKYPINFIGRNIMVIIYYSFLQTISI